MNLDQLPFLYWVKLAVGLMLFLGPGYLLLQVSSTAKELDLTHSLIASFSISIAFLAILFEFANILNVVFSAATLIPLFLLCGLVGVLISKPWRKKFKLDKSIKYFRVALWFMLVIYFLINLWSIRNEVAGSGSDSYHHTLITQMIIDNGRLPHDFGQFFPIISFTYHFGFHTTAAFLGWTSKIPTILLILVVGKILVILCSASISLLTEKITGNRWAGLISAVVVLICIFPSHMLEWGRYTQLTGLTITIVFTTFFWLWIENNFTWKEVPLLALLAAGIGLSHYRVVTMAIIGAITIFCIDGLRNSKRISWNKVLVRGGILIGTTLLFVAPWLLHIWLSDQTGYEIITNPMDPKYYTWKRLGEIVLNYPTNIPLLSLLAICMIIGWIKKSKVVITFTIWFILLLLPSRYAFIIDATSVRISLFIPLAVIIGTISPSIPALFIRSCNDVHRVYKTIMPIFLAVLYIGGAITAIFTPLIHDGYLRKNDLKAMEFIKEYIPTDAYFMVNLYRFPFSDILMVGSDAGYWIPLLANRKAVAPPMIFTFERVSDPGYADNLRQLEGLNGDLVSDESLNILRKEGITHIYTGVRGGPINPEKLLLSSDYRLIYQDDGVFIFELLNKDQ